MRGSGWIVNEEAGENLGIHKLVYRNASGTWSLADADLAATMPVLGITMGAISIGRKGEILLWGYIGDNTWSWTAGDEIYASATAGELTQTIPAGAGDIVQTVAVAITTLLIQFQGNLGSQFDGSNTLEGHTAYVGFDASKALYINYFLCDETADDVQIQAAIDYVIGLGGGSMFLERGNYDITAAIIDAGSNIPVTIQGTGIGTLLTVANNADVICFDFNGDDKNIFDLKINGNKAISNTRDVILVEDGDRPRVERCEVINGGRHGIYYRNVTGGWVVNNYISNCGSGGVGNGVNIGASSDDVHIEGNNISSATVGGIGLIDTIIDAHVSNNNIHTCTVAGIYSGGAGGANFFIRGNKITDNCSTYGIGLDGSGTESIISDNIIEDVDGYGILVEPDYCMITDNVVINAATRGITLYEASYTEISDNKVISCDRGIYIDGTGGNQATDNHIHGNYVQDSATEGIRLTSNAVDNTVLDNILRNNVDEINDQGVNTGIHTFFAPLKDPDTTLGDHPAVELTDGETVDVYDQITIPQGFQEIVTAVAAIVPGGTGNMRWQCDTDFGKLCAGENYNTHSDAIVANDTAVTQNELECMNIADALTSLAGGDLVGVKFTRLGGHANDTVNANCYYMGLRVRFV
jgi:parallel beta-helix repeat protein